MFVLLMIPYTNAKIFKLKTYKHHICAIFFNFFILLILHLTSFILSIHSENKNNRNIYKGNLWLLPIGTIIYSLTAFISSYFYSKMKWFMDFNWISLTKLFLMYNLIGFLTNMINCIILTYIKCWGEAKYFFCGIQDKEKNYYVENIFIFFETFSDIYVKNKIDFIFLIFIIFIITLLTFFYILFFFQILKNFYPEYYFITRSLTDIFFK